MEHEVHPPKVVEVVNLLGRSKVEFCYHALEQMKIRGITESEVFKAIRNPSETGLPTQEGRERVRKFKKPTKAIDIVYELREDKIIVVTAFPKQFPKRSR